jgi:hypothetical protein
LQQNNISESREDEHDLQKLQKKDKENDNYNKLIDKQQQIIIPKDITNKTIT